MLPTDKPFLSSIPGNNNETRDSIYRGDIYLSDSNDATTSLVKDVKDRIQKELGVEDIRKAHLELSDAEFFERMGNLRKLFYLDEKYHDHLRNVIASYGFNPNRTAFDPIRIRVILPGGHRNPKAAPVYFPHRDTWYAHPQSLIVGWIPLHDLSANETFEFFPDYFDQEVPNNSEIFDYADWIKDGPALKIGWQNKDSGLSAGYSKASANHNPGRRIRFCCESGEALFFAGSHYHQTLEQDLGTIRYSLDFRLVNLDDVKLAKGSPNSDNRSKGDILSDYIQP